MRSFAAIFVVSAVVLAVSFTDNFDSYTPGSDLSSSPYWSTSDSSGSLIIAEEGSNMIAKTVWNSSNFIGYACLGSAVWADGTVGCDVKFTGLQGVFALMARANTTTSESFVAGIYPVNPPTGATFIAYVDSTGESNIFAQDFFYPMYENTWYTLEFNVEGSDSVNLSLSVNGSVNSQCLFTEYRLAPGLSGMVAAFDSTSAPSFSIDNFEVTDNIQSFTTTTFGGIKAFFR